ncbi:hypothetical protein L7F22_018203 [Adiantum nelumboides]|nr:hypothetical protein [Adiantum nelumboides]
MIEKPRDVLDVHKSPSMLQCVEVMRKFFDELQSQTKKGPFSNRKAAPIGLFCMSGPVAHADDDENDEDDEFDDVDFAATNLHMQKDAQSFVVPPPDKLSFSKTNDHGAPCSRKQFSSSGNGVEFLYANQPFKCRWPDGCTYEGDQSFDKGTGRGKIYWPSGSCYEGEFMGGHLNGVGTFRGADGTVYKGNWILNRKHGFGRKRYSNGDVYEGTWKWDVPEGQGCYFWSNGSEYYGGWKGGLMSGRGVLAWASGHTYDGQWLNGLADGRGVYTWYDGSMYFGTWRKGLKHGGGRFYPPGSKHIETERLHYTHSLSREELTLHDRMNATIRSPCRQKICSPSHLPQELRRLCRGPPFDNVSSDASSVLAAEEYEESDFVTERPWSLGDCDCCDLESCPGAYPEWVLDGEEGVSQRHDIPLWEDNDGECSWQLRERKRFGETIYKGHRSYDLMINLQFGIRYSVSKVTPEKRRKLFLADFGPKSRLKVCFPREGSQLTPPHHSGDFKWKDYCPMVFRYLREIFKIDAADYMLSICGNTGLRELSSPGKSGSVFYLSQDERFIIKTLRKAEVKVLLKMLPKYYNHVRMHRNTLLTRFFGLHRIKPAGGQKVRFIVMGNVVSTEACIHRRFDLKGSSQGRFTGKHEADEGTTLKDLDLDLVFQLDPSWRSTVLEQISRDCQFLESEHIMDYSLLLGLHFKNAASSSAFSDSHGSMFGSPLHEFLDPQAIARSGLSDALSDFSSPQTERCVQVGCNMPARACRRLGNDKGDLDFDEVYDVVLYFGIIDILQEYDMGKRLEHAYKSLQFDSFSISAVDPALYSKRFQHFMNGIFPPVT